MNGVKTANGGMTPKTGSEGVTGFVKAVTKKMDFVTKERI